MSGLRVAFIGAFAASILAHPSPSNAETVVWVRDNAAIELVEARELVDSVSVMRLDSATFQLCTGCISSAYTFVPVELLAGHESGGATGLLDPDAEPAWVGGISTPARRSALLVFADQRRADRPDATFEIVGQPAEHGASAEIQVAVQSAAHCETSFWQLVLLDIDSGVTALDSAERTERKESEGCANEE